MRTFASDAADASNPSSSPTAARVGAFKTSLKNLGSPCRQVPRRIDEMNTRAVSYLTGEGKVRLVLIPGEDDEMLFH